MIIKQSFLKKALSLSLGISLFSFTPEILADQSRILYAGQHTEVGVVDLYINGDTTTVDYTITTPGWCLNLTHLYVGTTEPEKIAPGQFPYAHADLGCTQFDSYEVPTSQCGYVAAHAEVTQWSVPIGGEVTYKVSHGSSTNIQGLFDGQIWLDGEWQTHLSRCVDLNHSISSNIEYTCTLYSSLDMNAPVDKPENLDLLNYMLNHQDEYMADLNLGGLGLGAATKKDILAAGWTLVDNSPIPNNLKGNQLRVDYIVNQAFLYGEGFIPGPDDIIGIIIYCGTKVQVTLMEFIRGDIELGSETAWAQGDFPFLNNKGKPTGWGTYFQCH